MLREERRLLVTGLQADARRDVEDGLAACRHRVTEAADGVAGLELARRRRFDALIVSHPLAGERTGEFLRAVRAAGSPCRSAGLVLVTPARHRPDAEGFVGRGANRVLLIDEVPQRLPETLEPLFRVAPRFPLVVSSRIEVVSRERGRRLFCQTVNVSASGMLLRVPHSYAPGTELWFELFLPRERGPVRGRARVVRQTEQRREPFPGIGVLVEEFAGDDLSRLTASCAATAG